MIDELKAITDNLEDAESDIASLDSDGVISFHHTSQKDKFQQLYEDFEVLHRFTGKVGDIVDRTIDQPFYEDIDAFVEAMRDLSISNYTTKNRVGATEVKVVYAGYGQQNTLEVPKTEVSIDDLFNGDNFYAEQIKLEYDAWKELNPDQDFSQKEYQLAAVNTNAFEYESIRNHQESKEFWGQIAALVVIVGVSLVCPPAGIALGAAYGTFELSSAVSGKEWISGRELGTGERVFRGLLSPLDIIPGVSSVAKFSGTVKFAHLGDIGISSVKTGIKNSVNNGMTQVRNLVETAGKASTTRLKSAASMIKDVPNKLKNKLIDDTIEVGRFIDSTVTHTKNIFSTRKPLDLAIEGFGNTGSVRIPVENTHAAENYFAAKLGRGNGVSGGSKGTDNYRQIDFTRGFDVDPKYSTYEQRVKTTPVNKGEWSNERAESLFISDKTGEIKKYLDEAGVDGVEYKNGMPDFSPFSKGEIKLENMTNDRKSNFSTADEELAKKWSTPEQKWTAEDIADWREDNKYTWHELNDLETIQLVPSKINSVFKHLGGVGEYNIKVKLGE
ncbi:HNH endonuclease [Bacillus sporothermodurans]|nr:HNH endonuclease [Heyndrickxia sporothermodurans]MBL5772368.1 HNH endonuclease [Heyndrickxia sporothermodurans]MBL5782094.1 HNH endonuclease [Heyndrickxia sporothermodurans]MBL5786517.1 HNH endonuclease [Heyndrickxia sporothermodurans]MBL5790101.1 HNH endonuclease [Heyndrickxia sporothermodurans]